MFLPRYTNVVINKRPFTALLFLLFFLLAIPYLFVIVGDAQVHLAVAENFSHGRPFQYNPNGEIVVASTSPFWTLLLILFYYLTGHFAPLLLKLAVVIIWAGTAVLLQRIARQQWHFAPAGQLAVVGLWLGHTTIVSNALGGLENILSAFQLLLLYFLLNQAVAATSGPPSRNVWWQTIGLGLLIGWSVLTRPDGGIFVLALFGIYALYLLRAYRLEHWLKSSLPQLFGVGIVAILLVVPWYLYQYQVTGQLVTDSSVARLYNGRLGSLPLIPDQLYFHPKALISLATAFLPLSFGYLVYSWIILARYRNANWLSDNFVGLTAVFITLFGFIFYTFVVGAEAFGRYFLPLYPFLFLTGIAGIRHLHTTLQKRNLTIARLFLILTILFMVTTSLLDTYRRLVPGQFSVTSTLDIIYGPAHEQYVSFNLFDLVAAPSLRATYTNDLLQAVSINAPLRFAVTEVQLRYFLDERIEILSLDGRTSASILEYTNPTTGVPDFEHYFSDTQPNLVHVNQWCTVGGFLASIFPTNITDNLVCQWQKTADILAIGDSFQWQGRRVTVVAPEIVRIEWEN